MPNSEQKKVFVSYCRRDKDWLRRLQVHLEPLVSGSLIDLWDDTQIAPGSDWNAQIALALESANVAVLLISADFLGSEFISNNELPKILANAETSGLVVIPIILSPSLVERNEGLSRFQSVNPPSRPLTSMDVHEQERTFVATAQRIYELTNEATPLNRLPTRSSGSEDIAQAPNIHFPKTTIAEYLNHIDANEHPLVRQQISKIDSKYLCSRWNTGERFPLIAAILGGLTLAALCWIVSFVLVYTLCLLVSSIWFQISGEAPPVAASIAALLVFVALIWYYFRDLITTYMSRKEVTPRFKDYQALSVVVLDVVKRDNLQTKLQDRDRITFALPTGAIMQRTVLINLDDLALMGNTALILLASDRLDGSGIVGFANIGAAPKHVVDAAIRVWQTSE